MIINWINGLFNILPNIGLSVSQNYIRWYSLDFLKINNLCYIMIFFHAYKLFINTIENLKNRIWKNNLLCAKIKISILHVPNSSPLVRRLAPPITVSNHPSPWLPFLPCSPTPTWLEAACAPPVHQHAAGAWRGVLPSPSRTLSFLPTSEVLLRFLAY